MALGGILVSPRQKYSIPQIYTQVSIQKLKQVHSVTHPAKFERLSDLARSETNPETDAVRYRLEIKDEAREQLRALPKQHRRNIGQRLDALQNDLAGDVKKLAARSHEYRLRVGSFRVLFMLEGDLIVVYAVKDRKEAYE